MRRQRRRAHSQILVKVIERAGRKCYVLRWRDPLENRWREEATNIEIKRQNRRLAERAARDKEDKLFECEESSPQTRWVDFETRYRTEHLSGLAIKSQQAWRTVRHHVEKIIKPYLLRDVDASTLSSLVGELRKGGSAETTIASYLKTLHAALGWAKNTNLCAEVPKFPSVERAKGITTHMRSRPITGEELERMLKCTRRVRPLDYKKWQRFQRGLWLSGLRVAEAVSLSWDWQAPFAVVIDGEFPVFRVHAEGEKGHEDRILPMAPEFADFLRRCPESKRRGTVFGIDLRADHVSTVISAIGCKAKILVNSKGKFASAHDLRRSFGTRWAARISPADLKELMRHKSIETTLKYYVKIDAEKLVERLQRSLAGDNKGDTPPPRVSPKPQKYAM